MLEKGEGPQGDLIEKVFGTNGSGSCRRRRRSSHGRRQRRNREFVDLQGGRGGQSFSVIFFVNGVQNFGASAPHYRDELGRASFAYESGQSRCGCHFWNLGFRIWKEKWRWKKVILFRGRGFLLVETEARRWAFIDDVYGYDASTSCFSTVRI